MNSIFGEVKGLFHGSVRLLNQPVVKEGVKNVASSVTFLFGMMELYDIYKIATGREILTEPCSNSPKWVQIANKTVVVCAKISLVLSAGVSRPGVFIISSFTGCIFSAAQLKRIFGPNTIFAVNPWHPRHIISIAAQILAIPSIAQSTYKAINWLSYKINWMHKLSRARIMLTQNTDQWLTDSKIRLMVLFNSITSRPTLHIGNQLSRFILTRV